MSWLSIFLFFLFQQSNTAFIYERLQVSEQKEHLLFTTDKDYYFKGEHVFVGGGIINDLNTEDQKKWVYLFLFDQEKKVQTYNRVQLKEDLLEGSIQIPDSVTSKHLSVGAFLPESNLFFSRPLGIIDGERDDSTGNSGDLAFRMKSTFLIPETENEIYVINRSKEERKIELAGTEYFVNDKALIRFTPRTEEAYSINSGATSLPLPAVKAMPFFSVEEDDEAITFQINKIDTASQLSHFIVLAGTETIWLSTLADTKGEVRVDLSEVLSNYVIAFILDEDNKVSYYQVLSRGRQIPVDHSISGDSILISGVPASVSDRSFVRVVDKTFLYDRNVTFGAGEIMELSNYANLPDHNLFFGSDQEKQSWIQYELELNIDEKLAKEASLSESSTVLNLPKINYLITDTYKKAELLSINAIDLSGGILEYELIQDTLRFDVSGFQSSKSMMILDVNYKGQKLELQQLSSPEVSFLEDQLSSMRILDLKVESSSMANYFEYSDFLAEAKFLDEVVVTALKDRPVKMKQGVYVSNDELEITKYTVTADAFLSKVGALGTPDANTGYLKSIKPKYNSKFGAYLAGRGYPMVLVIQSANGLLYSGYDFHTLSNYPAEWVYGIMKVNSTPERIVFVMAPGFRDGQKRVQDQWVFSQDILNENAGVHAWSSFLGDRTETMLSGNTEAAKVEVFSFPSTSKNQ